MSQSRAFQRFFRPHTLLNQFNNHLNFSRKPHQYLTKTKSLFKLNNLKQTSAFISCGLILGWSIENYFELCCNWSCIASELSAGKVYAWGFNRYGQLGVGSENNENLPTAIDGLHDIIFVSCGAEQTAALTSDGKVYTFGRGQDARLGHGSTSGSNETYPRVVEELEDKNIINIDAGYLHMACVTDTGEVWTWGKNTYSQLGHSNGSYPNIVQSLKDKNIKACKVACGRYHTVVLDETGNVYSWGGWKSGETGTGKKRTTSEPTQVSSLSNEKIIDIKAGQDFTLFLSDNGNVYACGAGDRGQTGQGSSNERFHVTPTLISGVKYIDKIAAGQFHSICCDKNGNVYTFGLNREGQLGHGDTQNRTVPTQILSLMDPKLKVIDVAAGGGHSACIVNNLYDGKKHLFIFGRGRHGQIGRANNVGSVAANRPEPVVVDFFDGLKCKIQQIVLGTNHSAVLCC
eukprot:309818_1